MIDLNPNEAAPLIAAFATEYIEGRDPFNTTFLAEHKVTAEQCAAMTKFIGTLMRGFMGVPTKTKTLIMQVGQYDPVQAQKALFLWEFIKEAGISIEDLFDGSRK